MLQRLKSYGENSFTFAVFQAIAKHAATDAGMLTDVLLSNLKGLLGKKPAIHIPSHPDDWYMWLFPNFGRRHGFGEPDVVLLFDDCSFWFEVETRVHLRCKLPAFDQSLRQLIRFRLFAEAVYFGGTSQSGRREFRGVTVTDRGFPRRASILRAGHPVLKHPKFVSWVRTSVKTNRDYYVLMSRSKPTGASLKETKLPERTKRILNDHYAILTEWNEQPEENKYHRQTNEILPENRFFRIGWEGDLKKQVIKKLGVDPPGEMGFISRES